MRALLLLSLCITPSALSLPAQQPPAPPQTPQHTAADASGDAPPPPNLFTLHVYTDLVQMPTLVLSATGGALPPVPRDQFTLRIDSGPAFYPNKMRLEGDDPITLGILLDDSGDQRELLNSFDKALSRVATTALNPRDRIEIFLVDCNITRVANLLTPSSPALLDAVSKARSSPTLHGPGHRKSACYFGIHLWDALATAAQNMSSEPGRRVLLAVTSGLDKGSRYASQDVAHSADGQSVAVFGLQEITVATTRLIASRREDPFEQLCLSTGGIVSHATPTTLASELAHIITLVRGRYIIEFPRPANATLGLHQIVVQIPNRDAIVLPAGISFPLPDPDRLNDPNTLPHDAAGQPTQGTRAPMRKSR